MKQTLRSLPSLLLTALTLLCLSSQMGIYAATVTLTPSPTPAGPVLPPVCTFGTGWVGKTMTVAQGKQYNLLPVPLYRSETSYAYGPADTVYYTLGRGGSVTYGFLGELLDQPGADISIYEVTNGRQWYPLEQATVELSTDGTTWYSLNVRVSSRSNLLGITELDMATVGLASVQYIRLTDIINPLNRYPESDGIDINTIQGAGQDCSKLTPTITPSPTVTPSLTPSTTPTPSVTATPTVTVVPTNTLTPTPTASATPNVTLTPTVTTTPTVTASPTVTPTSTIAPTPILVTIDFSTPTASGSPLIFGGAQYPRAFMTDAWNKLAEVGVTSIRQDLFPEFALPPNITLEDYINNIGDVQNPLTWNRAHIDNINAIFTAAKARGMKTFGIMAYSPAWLNTCNCRYGVPKDFNVYKDIVKKTYREHRSNIDYLEIWNEPTHPFFLQLTNSPLSSEEAYLKMFNEASSGIREVDTEINDGKRAFIGGLVADAPDEYTMLTNLVTNPNAKANLDFISYHAFDKIVEPSWTGYKNILTANGLPNLPIYITEWNYFYNDSVPTPFNGGAESVSYTGRKFIEYLRFGLQIANYHSVAAVNTSRPNNGVGTYGFYIWDGTTATLLEQSKTWRLFSKTLKLGSGPSIVFSTQSASALPAVAFKNFANQKGIALVNETQKPVTVTINASGLTPGVTASRFEASQQNDGSTAISIWPSIQNGFNTSWSLTVPALSVTGLLLQ